MKYDKRRHICLELYDKRDDSSFLIVYVPY
jgi:hypothetical protein